MLLEPSESNQIKIRFVGNRDRTPYGLRYRKLYNGTWSQHLPFYSYTYNTRTTSYDNVYVFPKDPTITSYGFYLGAQEGTVSIIEGVVDGTEIIVSGDPNTNGSQTGGGSNSNLPSLALLSSVRSVVVRLNGDSSRYTIDTHGFVFSAPIITGDQMSKTYTYYGVNIGNMNLSLIDSSTNIPVPGSSLNITVTDSDGAIMNLEPSADDKISIRLIGNFSLFTILRMTTNLSTGAYTPFLEVPFTNVGTTIFDNVLTFDAVLNAKNEFVIKYRNENTFFAERLEINK